MGDKSTYIIIRSTVPYSAARETTTSVGLAHARPISGPAHYSWDSHIWSSVYTVVSQLSTGGIGVQRGYI